jgi:hypothetical protein
MLPRSRQQGHQPAHQDKEAFSSDIVNGIYGINLLLVTVHALHMRYLCLHDSSSSTAQGG